MIRMTHALGLTDPQSDVASRGGIDTYVVNAHKVGKNLLQEHRV